MKKFILLGSTILLLAAGCSKSTSSVTSSTTTPATDNSITWNTYTNTQYGFHIDYPILQSKSQVVVTDGEDPDEKAVIKFEYLDSSTNQYSDSFDIFIDSNPSGLSLEQWFETNEDINSDIEKAGQLQITNIAGGQKLFLNDSGGLPSTYLSEPNDHPIYGQLYFMPDSKQNVLIPGFGDADISLSNYSDHIIDSFGFIQP